MKTPIARNRANPRSRTAGNLILLVTQSLTQRFPGGGRGNVGSIESQADGHAATFSSGGYRKPNQHERGRAGRTPWWARSWLTEGKPGDGLVPSRRRSSLVGAQGGHRVDVGRAVRGKPGGEPGGGDEAQRGAPDRQRIERIDIEEER